MPLLAPLLSLVPCLLAQADPAAQSMSILRWLGVILVLSLAIVVFALYLRRRLQAEDEDPLPDDPGFTLGDLRDMHAQGKLTDEEFATAKAAIIARSRAMLHPEEVNDAPFPTEVTPIEPSNADADPSGEHEDEDEGEGDSDPPPAPAR